MYIVVNRFLRVIELIKIVLQFTTLSESIRKVENGRMNSLILKPHARNIQRVSCARNVTQIRLPRTFEAVDPMRNYLHEKHFVVQREQIFTVRLRFWFYNIRE